ncbi:MAG: MEDS domain-containing protein [Phycisphaerae bacterium]
MAWGAHILKLYRTPTDLLRVVVPYLKAGLAHNECCLWVTDSVPVMKAELALAAAVRDFHRRWRHGQIDIMDSLAWYLAGPQLDPARVLAAYRRRLKTALASGFDGLRLVADMSWVDGDNWDKVLEYETAGNRLIGRYRIIALCCYPVLDGKPLAVPKIKRLHSVALAPGANGHGAL